MINLYQFSPCLSVRNPSPFCLKLETYLRMANLPYEADSTADVRKAPKKKFPYIQDGDVTIADSNFVVAYLKEKYGDPLDEHLSSLEKGISLAFCRLLEENLYWVILYSRWAENDNWVVVRNIYFSDLPPILRSIVPGIVRRDSLGHLYGHGMGRHSREEIYEIGERDIKALSGFLSDKPFLMGEKPSSLDASRYGFLANILRMELPSKLVDYTRQFENLKDYCDSPKERLRHRMETTFWN